MPNSNVNNSCMRGTWIIIVLALFSLLARSSSAHDTNAERIQPWPENPRYWQYKGQPVMLLGGSKTDHIFLLDDLEPHLDEIQEVGANYVRCTMSQREGLDLKAHKLLPNGKFDLDQWNEEYRQQFLLFRLQESCECRREAQIHPMIRGNKCLGSRQSSRENTARQEEQRVEQRGRWRWPSRRKSALQGMKTGRNTQDNPAKFDSANHFPT